MRRRAFQGLRRYQEAARPAPPPAASVYAAHGSARLLRHGADGDAAPVVFIPSLINPPQVLDIAEGRSLLRGMSAAGHDAYLVDWGTPHLDAPALDLAGHITGRLMPLLAGLPAPPILVGYCLGGTLALGAAHCMDVRAVATIAAPWNFDGFPNADREQIAALWAQSRAVCGQIGFVPMEVLQSGFWALDPARTVRKYAAFADMPPGSDKERAFLTVEDWANGGPPLTYPAGAQLFDHFYAADITGNGLWVIDGQAVDPAALPCPTFSISSSTDRIVPACAGPPLAEQLTLDMGHVGMILGGSAPELLWKPLSAWLSRHGG
ncbi:alpha/beta hydrolase [Sphingobium sp. AN641]|uniref:alpha/beta hydrolase n=1 Tax=Sphingobium sp. AN641 TaxID=3133443 RepID=UPI0030BC5415